MNRTDANGKSVFAMLATLFGVMFVGLAITAVAQLAFMKMPERDAYLWGAVVQDILCFILPAILAAGIFCGKKWSEALAIDSMPWKSVMSGAVIYILYLPALNALTYWNEHIHLPQALNGVEKLFREMEDKAALITNSILDVSSVWGMLCGVIVVGLMAALSEELFFRAGLQRMLAGRFGMAGGTRRQAIVAIWVGAIVFSVMHFQMFGFAPRMLLGAYFGYLLYKSGSIWPGVVAHFLNNSLVVVGRWCITTGYLGEDTLDFGTPGHTEWLWVVSLVAGSAALLYARKCWLGAGNTRRAE